VKWCQTCAGEGGHRKPDCPGGLEERRARPEEFRHYTVPAGLAEAGKTLCRWGKKLTPEQLTSSSKEALCGSCFRLRFGKSGTGGKSEDKCL
jgi:hypothetical protein